MGCFDPAVFGPVRNHAGEGESVILGFVHKKVTKEVSFLDQSLHNDPLHVNFMDLCLRRDQNPSNPDKGTWNVRNNVPLFSM